MLHKLQIQNYALIDFLEIEFGKGLNIITGETGAGKSIIMGGLSLILGQRAENKFLFDPTKKCIIEGFFDLSSYSIRGFFEENDLDFEDYSIIRRELTPDGKSRAFVNDTPVTLQVLKSLSERLIDIHSQHATLQLANMEFQLQVLDSVSGTFSLISEFRKKLKDYGSLRSNLVALRESAKQDGAEYDYKQFLFNELEEANLFLGEQVALEEELRKLENAEEIKNYLHAALQALDGDQISTHILLKESLQSLQKASVFLPQIQNVTERLQSVWIEAKDIIQEVERADQDVFIDQNRLQEVQDRLGVIYGLLQKHRVEDESALLELLNKLANFLQKQDHSDEEILKLEKQCHAKQEELELLAIKIRELRLKNIGFVEEEILKTLALVGMPDCQIRLECLPLNFEKYRADGGDSLQILFTSNKGQDLKPVGKVASGGELSRLMLAVKSLIAKNSTLPTIVFDEIDTGISGEVAMRVGDVMENLGVNMQVIAISHLPQIASKKGTHFKVFKENVDERTKTQMRVLSQEDRVHEIAQMLSGSEPGQAALEHAKNLLSQ